MPRKGPARHNLMWSKADAKAKRPTADVSPGILEAFPQRGRPVPGVRRGGVADMIVNEPPPPAGPSTHLGVGPIMLRLAGGRGPEHRLPDPRAHVIVPSGLGASPPFR